MEASLEDRRVRKTKRQLRSALAEQMRQKNISRITVRELCDMVDISRGTFYAHYKDVYDLVEQVEDDLYTRFVAVLNSHTLDRKRVDLGPMNMAIFTFMQEEKELAVALLCNNGNIAFMQRLQGGIREYFERCLGMLDIKVDEAVKEHTFTFLISGYVGLVQQWLLEGTREEAEAMASIATRLAMSGLSHMVDGHGKGVLKA